MIDESKEAKKAFNHNGSLQVHDDDNNPHSGNSSDRSPGVEYRKTNRFGFKTASTASRFAAKISPKSTRKRIKYKTALCKVTFFFYLT